MAEDKEIAIDTVKVSATRTGDRVYRKTLLEQSREIPQGSGLALAEYSLRKAYRYISGQLLMKTSNPEGTGGSVLISDDEAAKQQRYIDRAQEWANECSKQDRTIYNVTLDYCAFDFTYRQIAEQRASSPATVMRRIKDGLRLYCDLNGLRY